MIYNYLHRKQSTSFSRRLPHSQSFREESCSIPEGGQPFRRTNSECTYGQFQQQHDKSDQGFAQEVDVSQWKLGYVSCIYEI